MKDLHRRLKQPIMRETVNIVMQNDSLLFVSRRKEAIAGYAGTAGTSVFWDHNAMVAAQLLEGRSPVDIIDHKDDTWAVISKALLRLYQNIRCYEDEEISDPVFDRIEPDLPRPLARARLEILEKHGRICDIPAVIELSEICLAPLQNRPVNRELFRKECRNSSWLARVEEYEPEAIRRALETTICRSQKHSNDSLFRSSMAALEVAELKYALDHRSSAIPTLDAFDTPATHEEVGQVASCVAR
ncbi:hypothetical protein BTO32_15095 [Marinobacter lutaoensis]|uniref:Uncharacterized protein n=1 Tax=Marinobacter lutaoensis TaxID=135739 RepID=A0A1V2DPH4_9GAMM|nr:hypothetical protein [Marinobacter lutaoensis]ONF42534.1 hypothetical protein BTO32_15095 [Marinobacter lutaoensis]